MPLTIRYMAPANKALDIPAARLVLTAVGRELPVSAERSVIDFTCVTLIVGCHVQPLLCAGWVAGLDSMP